jgi:uncharacterized protein (DUF427 family)
MAAERQEKSMNIASSRQASAELSIEPYAGTVTVTFSDAIIASTDKAKILRQEGRDPVFCVPFEDIYFEFLQKTKTTSRCPIKGTATYWRVSAVGDAADDAMRAYETPNPVASEIARHGVFDETIVRIEAIPAKDWLHTPHIVE